MLSFWIFPLFPILLGMITQPQPSSHLYAFTLGREWKLSLAEVIAVFGATAYREHSEQIALFEITYMTESTIIDIFATLWGSVRVMKILSPVTPESFPTESLHYIEANKKEGKIDFALGVYGMTLPLLSIGLRMKKTLIEKGIKARLINSKEDNIVSAVFKKERLGKTHNEYNLISLWNPNSHQQPTSSPANQLTCYLASTLACQDIDAYTKRDTAKIRDMQVGMLPPKLAQMMINLAIWEDTQSQPAHQPTSQPAITIYDPFCGLGTILIEAANMGITSLLGSDISKEMVRSSQESLDAFIKEEIVWQERIKTAWGTPKKDFSKMELSLFEMDVMKILENLKTWKLENCVIVSEGYLGEIMQKESITLDRVKEERRKLARMYDAFFGWLESLNFSGTIVMTFPFWNIRGTESFFTEIAEILETHHFKTIPLLPEDLNLTTRKWTLLYKRPDQQVGREVWRGQLRQR